MNTGNAKRIDRQVAQPYHNSRFANLYDLGVGELLRWGTRHKAIIVSGWRPGEKVLDLCTGTGGLALAFAMQGAQVVGTDIARAMLKRASVKGMKSDARWLEMDSARLAFADQTFEISVLSLALHHMPETVQYRVLKEVRRVTSRRVVIIEPDVPVKPNWVPLWKFVASIIDESEYMHEWAHQDFIGTCESAGLKVESVDVSTFGIHRILSCDPNN